MGKQFNEKLLDIQSKLKAPKNQYNSFGKYHYRSCEDVLEALKPILVEHKCLLTITDEVVMIGSRYYIKATATISDGEDSISVNAYAREEETKKGADGSQVTGASSSYARKYALNGLFCIDDNKDSDTTNVGQKAAKTEEKEENPLLDMAVNDARNAYSLNELREIWTNHPNLHNNARFKVAVNQRKAELEKK